MGQDVLGQGFDDIDWVGIFEKAPRGEIYYNNVSDEGEIMTAHDIGQKLLLLNPLKFTVIHVNDPTTTSFCLVDKNTVMR